MFIHPYWTHNLGIVSGLKQKKVRVASLRMFIPMSIRRLPYGRCIGLFSWKPTEKKKKLIRDAVGEFGELAGDLTGLL